MRKSTVVKKVKSKSSALPKRIKKYDDGGIQGLKKNTNFDPVVPGKTLQKTGEKTFLGKEKTEVINMPTAPKTEVTKMNLKSEAVPANKQLKKIEMRDASAPSTATTAPTKNTKVSTPKAKLLPGGFTSEAQRKAYTESLRQKIKSGKSVDQLVKEGYGTKKGLSDLGLGKYSEGLDLKKKGQAKKAEGLALKNKAKNTDYKKQWNDDLLNKAVDKKSVQKLTDKEMSYLVRKNGKKTLGIVTEKDNLTSKQKKAFNNVRLAQFERAKPEMRKTLEESVMMMTPRGIIKQAVKKGGEFVFSKGAQEFIKNSGRNSSEYQKLLGQGQKLLGSGTKKAADETVKKAANETVKKVASKTTKKAADETAKKVANKTTKKAANETTKKVVSKTTKKSDKVVKSKKPSEETILGRTKSQIAAFEKRNKQALDNDWAIIDSYRRGGKAKTSKKTVAKVSVMRRGGKK